MKTLRFIGGSLDGKESTTDDPFIQGTGQMLMPLEGGGVEVYQSSGRVGDLIVYQFSHVDKSEGTAKLAQAHLK